METSFYKVLSDALELEKNLLREISQKRTEIMREEAKTTERIKALQILLQGGDTKEINSTTMSPPPKLSDFMGRSIVGFISNFIATRNGAGITHRQIADALVSEGLECHRNYPYVVVSKLKDEGKVLEKDGKLYWSQNGGKN